MLHRNKQLPPRTLAERFYPVYKLKLSPVFL
ncbi:hypothetical protein BGLA2_1030014 [Burkholderia gladioli]|nr:hypothetical protein BGLA2_1030014 [Burkholderia gladioli]